MANIKDNLKKKITAGAKEAAHKIDDFQDTVKNKIEDQAHKVKSEAKKLDIWGNLFDTNFSKNFTNSTNNFVDLANNSIYGIMHVNNDCAKQTQNMFSKISTNASNTIEQNMELSGNLLKCQTATDVIELQQKFFEMNFSNMINLYSDLGHCCQSMVTNCCENASVCAEKVYEACSR